MTISPKAEPLGMNQAPGKPCVMRSSFQTISCMSDNLIQPQMISRRQAINSLCSNLLNANQIYGRVQLTNIFRVLLSILALIYFFESLGIYALIISFWIGVILSLVINVVLLVRLKFSYHFVFSCPQFDHQTFFKRASSAYLHNGGNQFFIFILTASASFLVTLAFSAIASTNSPLFIRLSLNQIS